MPDVDRPAPHQVALMVVPGSTPIEGSIAVDGEPSRRFRGWLDLISAIDGAARLSPVDLSSTDTAGDAQNIGVSPYREGRREDEDWKP